MAYNNNYNSYNNQRQPSRGGFTPAPAAPVEPKAIPANYVDLAETLMSANSRSITTSKLRNWFSIANDIYNVESRRQQRNRPEAGKLHKTAEFARAHCLRCRQGFQD